jgi:hypothetical protein
MLVHVCTTKTIVAVASAILKMSVRSVMGFCDPFLAH